MGIAVLITEKFANIPNDTPVLIAIIFVPILLLIFRWSGNFLLSGNIVTVLTALAILPSADNSNGLLSDNLVWGIFVPIIALLFANLLSGFIWLMVLIAFATWILFNRTHFPDCTFLETYNARYFYFSYVTLFIAVFIVINIFKLEQYKLIKSLSEKNLLLEAQKTEISQKTKELEETTASLEASNKELEQFAYIASHDLKEPLRMISMYTQMIQRRLKGQLEGETIEFMGYVTDGVKRMQQMLEDLLNYSRLGKTQDFVKVDLNNTLFMVEQNLRLTIREHQATITYDTLPTIYAVNSEITQLFQNLVANSIKFYHKDRKPEIKITVKKIDNESFTLLIKDNGIGIPEDSKHRIFNLFERLHNRSEYQGTGIGLATCRKVMDNLGGEVWVESIEGIGSDFFLKFPNAVLEPLFDS
jgi:signal transduction histidine kinase